MFHCRGAVERNWNKSRTNLEQTTKLAIVIRFQATGREAVHLAEAIQIALEREGLCSYGQSTLNADKT
jgi:hypothetical protein